MYLDPPVAILAQAETGVDLTQSYRPTIPAPTTSMPLVQGNMQLERDLSAIIEEVRAPDRVQAFLIEQELDTCQLLMDAVQNIDEVESKIGAKLNPPATSMREIASLRNLWRRAKVDGEKALKNLMEVRTKMDSINSCTLIDADAIAATFTVLSANLAHFWPKIVFY